MADPIEVITAEQLVSYPGAGSPSPEAAAYYVQLVNGMVTEAWAAPVDPVPFWVQSIALEAAARVSRNPKRLQSWTRSVDDGSRTERASEADLQRAGLFLTEDDRARLGGRRQRRQRFGTIRVTPGW